MHSPFITTYVIRKLLSPSEVRAVITPTFQPPFSSPPPKTPSWDDKRACPWKNGLMDGWTDFWAGVPFLMWVLGPFFLSFFSLSQGCVSPPNTRSLHHHGLREVVWARDSWCLKGRFRLWSKNRVIYKKIKNKKYSGFQKPATKGS